MSDSTMPPSVDPTPERPPASRSWRWRILRFMILGFVSLVTLFALFHAEENWRGKRTWERYQKEMEQKGAVFTYELLIPPPVPEEKNLAMTPLLKPVMEFNSPNVQPRWKDTNAYNRALEVGTLKVLPENGLDYQHDPPWRLGSRFDLGKWQKAFLSATNFPRPPQAGHAGEDVLLALTRFSAELEELRRASLERPLARFDINYEQEDKAAILLPHLSVVKGITRTFKLHALACLAQGRVDEAFEDVNVMFRLGESVSQEPTLISHLVRLACFELAISTIWEGLADHQWKPDHLKHWQAKLSSYDFLKESHQAMKGERGFGNEIITFLRKYPHLLEALGGDGGEYDASAKAEGKQVLYRLIPKGWFYLEQVSYNQLFDQFILSPSAKNKKDADVARFKSANAEMDHVFENRRLGDVLIRHRMLANLLMPAVWRVTQKGVAAQSTADLAFVALALERYYLKHSDFPATLEGLVPEFATEVPEDRCAQGPLHYERRSETSYRLWSKGWNQKDDQGAIVKRGNNINLDEGDWTWPQVEKESRTRETGFE